MADTDIAGKLKILIVEDNEPLLISLAAALELNNFHVTTAGNVGAALHLIDSEPFDVLLSDLHMPGAGDGLTVVSAMRHKNPEAVTLLLSGYPELKAAVAAILLQADEVLVKPFAISALVETIRAKLHNRGARPSTAAQRVASILESDTRTTIGQWLTRVLREEELTRVALSGEQRTGHLPNLMRELVEHLREPRSLGTNHVSEAAVHRGQSGSREAAPPLRP
jgi:DNA-binding response OmpR family regulator